MITEANILKPTVIEVAKKMLIAARTAPKARGQDYLVLKIAEQNEIELISKKMREMAGSSGNAFFTRDADNILLADCIVLLGTKIKSRGLAGCGHCGFENCAEKDKFPNTPCTFDTGDLGIAIGSAVSVAMDNRIDNRVMFSIGHVVMALGLMGSDVKIVYGIPLSASSKNPFFDRK